MGYYTATYSFGTTGEKSLVLGLGGTPTWVRITMGARLNTTESGAIFSQGSSDGTRTHCFAIAPGMAKKWPYSGESNYVAVAYSSAGVKKFSATLSSVNPPFASDTLNLNVDLADSNYQLKVEVGN